ncbi:hypothetical protein ACFWOT_09040 [Streptomyces sp. NPDC058440]|uniref:hypothetical protein n=1 Tax=Streptomyces sp. NPDC058440 TaxID=3346501 RepID=UPI00365C366C
MVISERHKYAAMDKTAPGTPTYTAAWEAWGFANRLQFATEPLARGTVNNVGGLVPLRYVLTGR